MDKQQQVRDFLEATIKEKGLSLNSLSLQLGKNATYLFHFIKRHSPRRLDEASRRRLAKILEINEQSLCDFQLPNVLIRDKLSTASNLFNMNRNKLDDLISIDVIDMDGENKGRFENIKKNIIGHELISPGVFAAYCNGLPQDIKIIKVVGDAMSPTINSGDLIWVDTSYKIPVTDGIYIINIAGDVLIRRIQVNPFDNSFEISADNNIYKSFNTIDCKKLNICGKIVSITHKL